MSRQAPFVPSKHPEAIDYFNTLLADLIKVHVLGHEPSAPIDEDRLEEGNRLLNDLERCKNYSFKQQ